MRILFYGDIWETIICLDCDISTVRKKFYKWRDMGVFNMAYELMFLRYTKNRVFKRLFIDSTAIQNKNCSDKNVTYGAHKIKGKKQTKISIITDSKGCILSHINSNPRPYDNKFIKPLTKQLRVNLKKGATLAGDKGYINKQKIFNVKNKKIKLIVPKRKNQI